MEVKKTILVSMVLGLVLMVAGCTSDQQQSLESEEKASKTTVSTEAEVSTETSTETETSAEVVTGVHEVMVEVDTLESIEIAGWEMTSIAPKLFVDGKEATEINAALGAYIQEEYPLVKDGDYVDGWSTKLSSWGYNENMVSIVIYAHDTSTDYSTYEVFNYDLDTLAALESSEVAERLGMTDEELFDKTAECIKNFCAKRNYNLEKSLALINYDKITPFVMEDGTPGVLACVVPPDDSQFAGTESKCRFSLTTME